MADLRALISSNTRIALLRVLVLDPEGALHMSELIRRTGFSPRGVEKELKNLLAGGILKKEVTGNLHRYRLDPECPIAAEVRALIVKTVGIGDLIKEALKPLEKKIELAFIYGSFASGDFGKESDVDLFIVGKATGMELAKIVGPIQSEIGRSINIAQFSSVEYRKRQEERDHFITRVLEGQRIPLVGT
ncbi:MAG TPA: nucleotidyltransferase domain-containing protein [Syntrophobacteria bacterium]|nr:nucleotidyltransferase domain-containing protein [Syntrophobacteria bacterium]